MRETGANMKEKLTPVAKKVAPKKPTKKVKKKGGCCGKGR